MSDSKQIAGLLGPTIIAVTVSEAINAHIWANSIAPVIYLNGTVLFVAGLSIVRAHNYWIRGWPVIVTLVGWFVILLGLFRMFAPELFLRGVQSTSTSTAFAGPMVLSVIGIFLTFKAYSRNR
jgi:hypothetical protein